MSSNFVHVIFKDTQNEVLNVITTHFKHSYKNDIQLI